LPNVFLDNRKLEAYATTLFDVPGLDLKDDRSLNLSWVAMKNESVTMEHVDFTFRNDAPKTRNDESAESKE
jgi:hypothetical protein